MVPLRGLCPPRVLRLGLKTTGHTVLALFAGFGSKLAPAGRHWRHCRSTLPTAAFWWETAQQKCGLIRVVFEVLRCAPRDAALVPTQGAYEDAPGSAAALYTTARSRTDAKRAFLALAARSRSGTSGSAARVLRRVAPRRFGRRRLTHLDARRHRVGAATLCPLRARARRSAPKAEPPKRGPKELMKQGGPWQSSHSSGLLSDF